MSCYYIKLQEIRDDGWHSTEYYLHNIDTREAFSCVYSLCRWCLRDGASWAEADLYNDCHGIYLCEIRADPDGIIIEKRC